MRRHREKDLATTYAKHDDRVKAENQSDLPRRSRSGPRTRPRKTWTTLLDKAGINNQPVWNAKEVSENPHWKMRGALQWIDDPTFGDVHHRVRPSRCPTPRPRIKWAFKPVGADNEYILSKLCGYSGSKIADLEQKEII